MKKLLFLLLIIISPRLAQAQAFSTGYVGDKQNAMGGVGVGAALDAASMFLNPASMSFIKGNSASIGAAAAITNTAYLDANNNSLTPSSNPIGTPLHANVIYGIKDTTAFLSKFKFGIGVNTPYGGNIKYPSDWTGNQVITVKNLSTVVITPTVSYKLNNQLSFGASFIYSLNFLHVENAISVSSTSTAVLDFSSRGYGFNAGVYYKPIPKLSIGLGYASQVNNTQYKGTAVFNVPSSLASQFPSGPATFKSSVPQIISLGAGYDVSDKLLLAVDVNYSLWNCFKSTNFYYTNATSTSAVQSTILPNNYVNTVSVRVGAQYKVTDMLIARAGVSYEQTPVPSGYVYPDVPDADRMNYTLGVSYHITKEFSVDASYRFVDVMKRTTTNVITNMSGTYQTYGNVAGLTLNYNF